MKDLNYGLMRLVRGHKEGSFGTRAARQSCLQQCANTLHDLGFRKLTPEGIKPKHVEALVKYWQQNELSTGTIKNRLSHIRWWAKSVNKAPVVARDNDFYGIERRVYVSNINKARELDKEGLDKITDKHVEMALRLQAAFGLRREEAIKFSPSYADRTDSIVLKGSWTKGGKPRTIPVLSEQQRGLLDEARLFAGRGAMIPSNKNYIQQLRTYERNTAKAGLDRMHGLRHAYAQERYETLTGWKCPVQGGPARKVMDAVMRARDTEVRLIVSRELGHERLAIVAQYIGT